MAAAAMLMGIFTFAAGTLIPSASKAQVGGRNCMINIGTPSNPRYVYDPACKNPPGI